jgi:hypothetical protein
MLRSKLHLTKIEVKISSEKKSKFKITTEKNLKIQNLILKKFKSKKGHRNEK